MLFRKLAPQKAEWSTTAELLASLIEVVDFGNRVAFVGHHLKGQAPKPVVINRPGANNGSSNDAEADKPKLTRAAMRATLLGG